MKLQWAYRSKAANQKKSPIRYHEEMLASTMHFSNNTHPPPTNPGPITGTLNADNPTAGRDKHALLCVPQNQRADSVDYADRSPDQRWSSH